jgi:hypothetical protein
LGTVAIVVVVVFGTVVVVVVAGTVVVVVVFGTVVVVVVFGTVVVVVVDVLGIVVVVVVGGGPSSVPPADPSYVASPEYTAVNGPDPDAVQTAWSEAFSWVGGQSAMAAPSFRNVTEPVGASSAPACITVS